MIPARLSLRVLAGLWCLVAFSIGFAICAAWMAWQRDWDDFLDDAFTGGLRSYAALQGEGYPPQGLRIEMLSPAQAALAEEGKFTALASGNGPFYVTPFTIRPSEMPRADPRIMSIVVVSKGLRYPISQLTNDAQSTPAEKLGQVTKLLARYCSNPEIFVKNQNDSWMRLSGEGPWSCTNAPHDFRLWTIGLAVLAAIILLAHIGDIAGRFSRLAEALRNRPRETQPQHYVRQGPAELDSMVASINVHLDRESAQLQSRAEMLTGVSHDLGTPTTRLRLRAALLPDEKLRKSLLNDIDHMTAMIESALAYTRTVMNIEAPRRISLSALVQKIADDYQDLDLPVRVLDPVPLRAQSTAGLLALRAQKPLEYQTSGPILVMAQPLSLERALTNLVDNALKFGRRASLQIAANASVAEITVEDEGGSVDAAEMENLIAPFRRGGNAKNAKGFGLGLSIVATIAEQHGGKLDFQRGQTGLRVTLIIDRGLV